MAIYMENILVAIQTIEHHLKILERVLKTLPENLLELRLEKCYFLQTEIEYLRYIISEQGVTPMKSGIETIERFPIPKSTRDVHSFIVLCSYFSKFICNFASIAKPL